MVLYRKYRSQTLDELIGQIEIKRALKSAIASNRLSHAYLFCGPRGTGKTSTARILAKIVNCEKPVENEPCNNCSTCLSITDGSNLDVIEIDAASNGLVEDIRSLRENIKLSPSKARKKVYIIDEVHMLSTGAFNALLKILEEPPTHVLFILATTEATKIPATVLSRLTRMDFRPASVEELIEVLNRIIKAESLQVDDEAVLAIAKKAGGSFRDAVKLLDQLSNLGKIDLEAVEKSLGSGSWEAVSQLLENIIKKESAAALQKLSSLTEAGANLKEVNLYILEMLRQLLFIKNGLGEQIIKKEVEADQYQSLVKLADGFGDNLIFTLDKFQNSLEQMKSVSIPSLPLEMAIVESCMDRLDDGRLKVEDGGGKLKVENGKEKVESKIDLSSTINPRAAGIASGDARQDATVNPPSSTVNDTDIQKIADRWTYILETVRQYNYSLEALLRSAKIAECNEKAVTLEVPYSFHQRMMEAPKSRDLLESILSDILGRSTKVMTKLGKRTVRNDEVSNIEVAADDEIVRLASEIFNSESAS